MLPCDCQRTSPVSSPEIRLRRFYQLTESKLPTFQAVQNIDLKLGVKSQK